MMKPLISAVIPVYQVENYLRRCIDSVRAQTLDDWEIILVDDASSDRSGEICDAYGEEDPRIKVIHQSHQGLGAARNTGMKQCSGTCLYFLDSDDYIAPDAFEQMHRIMEEEHADIVTAGHNRVEPGKKVHCDSLGWPEFSDDQAVKTAVVQNVLPNFAWGKLYLRSLWEGISFPEGVLVEDMYAVPKVFARASHPAVIKTPLYFYSHENPGSIMNGMGDQYIRIRYGRFGGWRVHEEVAAKVCPDCRDECAARAVKAGIRAYLLNAGISALSEWEKQDIRRYLHARNRVPLPMETKFIRHLILTDSALLPSLGKAARELVCYQQKRRMEKIYPHEERGV